MSAENPENLQSSPKEVSDSIPNPQNPIQEVNPISPELKKISPDSIDHKKILFQPINDQISKIDTIYENATEVKSSLNKELEIIIKEIPQVITTEKIVTTTKTVIKDGKETSTTTIKKEIIEENNDKNNNGNIKDKIEEIIINNNNEIKEENENNINNIDNSGFQSNVTFGAPQQINNYNPILTSSNISFGVNNSGINNLNKNENISHNSNISDSNDKSSEQSNNIIIDIKKENDNENINNNKEPQIQVNFGFKAGDPSEKNEIKEIKLVENDIKFGFVPEKKNDKEKKEDKKDEMELEPEEIKYEIKEESKKEKKEPIFTKLLFDNNKEFSTNNQGQTSIFEQKLFKVNDSNKNEKEENIINLFPNNNNNINSIFENSQNTQETFLKNNSSLISQQNSEMPSAIFGTLNNPEENQNPQKTLNEIIKEGDVYNADSAKKTQINPTLNLIISSDNNDNNTTTSTNIITNPILIQSMNKGKNPFKNEEPKNIEININSNNTNDNIDTNESTMNKINIKMENNDKTISSPLANLAFKDQSKWFIQGNQNVNEIKVNPIFTSFNSPNPFNSIFDNNKKEQEENKNYKSSLFPGLEILKTKSESSAQNKNERKIRSNPVFPGSSTDLNVKKTKSNLFVDDNNKKEHEKEKEEEKKNPKEESQFFSEVISIGIPPVNVNENKPEDKKEENKEEKKEINKEEKKDEKKEENSSVFLSEVISIGIPPVNVNENKTEDKKEENKEESKEVNKEENKEEKKDEKKEEKSSVFLSEVISIGIPPENINENKPEDKKEENEEKKEDKPKKEIEDSQQKLEINQDADKNDNIEIIIEKKDDNKTQELFSDNKEKENLKDSEINISNILNSNLSMNNDTNKKSEEEEEKKKENVEKKNSINENEQKRKSLFGDLFTSQNNEINLDKLFLNPNQSSNIFDKDNNNKESIFSNENINNEKKEKENIYTNNQGKSILSSDDNFELFGSKMTPIKSVNLYQNQNNKENKENINDNNEQKEEKEDEEVSIDIKAENSENNENKKEEGSEDKKENSLINSNNNINNDNGENGSGSVIINLNKNKDNNNEKIIDENIKLQTNISKNEEVVLSEDEKEYNPQEIINNENPGVISLPKQKELNKKIYARLIKTMYRIIEIEKNAINVPEKKTVTLYDNTLSKFLKDFEDKIKNLKNLYIITIIKRYLEKDPKKQKEIVLEANIPKKRNELKKLYRNMINVIKNKLQKENQKYYYISILKILDKYKKITPKEKKDAYMKMKEKEIIKNKEIQKETQKENEKEKVKKLEQKESSSIISYLVFSLPLIFIWSFLK